VPPPRLVAALTDRRAASASGLILAAYLVAHLLELTSSLGGRDAFVGRLGAIVPPWLRGALLLPLGLHAALYLRRAEGSGRHLDEGVRRLQRLAGLVTLAFLVVHIGQAYVPALLEGQEAVYDRLVHALSLPAFAGVYVVGLAAASLHLAQGLEAVACAQPAPRVLIARALGVTLALLVFLLGVDVLSHFTAGRALFAL
jgi:succinate dehydrogenase/fumarate reductase cytochrome b subunit